MLNGDRYRILRKLQYLQEQDEINKKKEYKAALAKKDGKDTFVYNNETIPVKNYLYTDTEADAIIDKEEPESTNVAEINTIEEKKRRKKKKKADGMRSVKKGADNNSAVTKMDFLPSKVLKKIAADKKLDEFVEQLNERKKRRKKKRKSNPKPNAYQKNQYKASGARGKTMAKASQAYNAAKKAGKEPPSWIYKARDDSEAKERKKKGYKSRKRSDTGMYLSETMKRKLDEFVEMLDERKKRRKKKRKSSKKKSSAGKLSAKTKETLKKKAKKRGLTPSSVYAEYRKGLAAYYSSGSRKGMTAHQWAHARVNSANPSKSWAVVKKSKSKKK